MLLKQTNKQTNLFLRVACPLKLTNTPDPCKAKVPASKYKSLFLLQSNLKHPKAIYSSVYGQCSLRVGLYIKAEIHQSCPVLTYLYDPFFPQVKGS